MRRDLLLLQMFIVMQCLNWCVAAAGNGAIGKSSTTAAAATTVTITTTTTTITITTTKTTPAPNGVHHSQCNNEGLPFTCAGVCVKESDTSALQCRPIAYDKFYQKKCGGVRKQCNSALTGNQCGYPEKTSKETQPASGSLSNYCPSCGNGYVFSRNSDACVTPKFAAMDAALINFYGPDSFDSVDIDTPSSFLYDVCTSPATGSGFDSVNSEALSHNCKVNHCSSLMQTYDVTLSEVANKTFSENKPTGWAKMTRANKFDALSEVFWGHLKSKFKNNWVIDCTDTVMGTTSCTDPSNILTPASVKENCMYGDKSSSSSAVRDSWQVVLETSGSGQQNTVAGTICHCAKYYATPYVREYFAASVPQDPTEYVDGFFDKDRLENKKTMRDAATGTAGAMCLLSAGVMMYEKKKGPLTKKSGDSLAAFSLIY